MKPNFIPVNFSGPSTSGSSFIYAQLPAKIFDVRAMAKPIISTNVSDIPEILDGCSWIAEPENPRQLAKTIKHVFDHPAEAKKMGSKAREKCKREYGWEMMEKRLVAILGNYGAK